MVLSLPLLTSLCFVSTLQILFLHKLIIHNISLFQSHVNGTRPRGDDLKISFDFGVSLLLLAQAIPEIHMQNVVGRNLTCKF